MAKGILFNLVDDLPSTNIPLEDVEKLIASAKENLDGTVSLSFTLVIKNASIAEMPVDLGVRGFLPFADEINNEIELKGFTQGQRQAAQFDDPAEFDLSVDWPEGKIGGANALKAKLEEKRYS